MENDGTEHEGHSALELSATTSPPVLSGDLAHVDVSPVRLFLRTLRMYAHASTESQPSQHPSAPGILHAQPGSPKLSGASVGGVLTDLDVSMVRPFRGEVPALRLSSTNSAVIRRQHARRTAHVARR
jgi:hypothetical protein